MCGITGIFHFDPSRQVDKSLLKKMTDTLHHRGPDGEGYYNRNNIGLGHRRLSIIDLSTGDQPMFSEDESIATIFNGEIYNYIELKEELSRLGCSFKTSSDTEVIIKAYQTWGVDCLKKFNGMWAIALWDEKNRSLFISRDRIGEKPLFYAVHDNTFVFGSEIKALLAYGHPRVQRTELTELYLSLGYIPAPHTFFKGISKLKAGHYLLVTPGSVTEKKYWDLPEIDEENMLSDKKKAYSIFEELLTDSVRIRMRSDVPYGAFLSGGLDSASVVALMSGISREPVRTFTIGSDRKSFDERQLAQLVAKKFKTQHSEYVVDAEGFEESLRQVLHHFDEPFGDSSAIPTGKVSSVAAKQVKMVLTGDGGDEVLSGYNSNLLEKFAEQYQQIPSLFRAPLPGIAGTLAGLMPGDRKYKWKQIAKGLSFSEVGFEERLIAKSWCPPALLKELLSGYEKQFHLKDFLQDFFAQYRVTHPFYKLMFFQFKVLLPDDFLVKVDRMSMAHSLETRVPFLDHRLVEFMAHVHRDVKMQGYERKSVLRNSVARRLPSELLRAPKRGFSIPMREWFKDKSFNSSLASLSSSDSGLQRGSVQRIIDDNKTGKQDFGNLLWMLFVLRDWQKA